MAGKASVFASPRLHYAIDKLSKNALVDLVIDLVQRDIGEDHAVSEEAVAAKITEWMGPVSRHRGDRPIDLNAQLANFDANAEAYRNKTGRHRMAPGYE